MATRSIPHRWRYDVFVSFRGEDVRKNFMDHLFKDFRQKGIHAFRDDSELPLGEKISPELYKAIEESRFLLVIFSKDYASSTWCLRELEKILQCKQIGEHNPEVRVIFYDVKPNVVRKQTESYAEAFKVHESSNRTEVGKWREALSMAADLSGWDLQDMTNGYEAKFIENISKEILQILCHEELDVGENIVGVHEQVEKLNLFRFIGSDKVHMIGICGISGIGKTTLAKAIYNSMHRHFEGCCFCEDVHDKKLVDVQMHIIGNLWKTRDAPISNISHGIMLIRRISKPILLVLDDVNHRKQLEALAGSHGWFCPGSLIIFTSQDKKLLRSHRVDDIYEMEFLDDDDALELFSLSASGKEHSSGEFIELTSQIVNCLQGHPLALKVVGRSLCNEPIDEWKSQLQELQRCRNKDIIEIFRPVLDRLDIDQKRILLDVACCFIWEKEEFVATVLDSYNCCAKAEIKALVDKSLITMLDSYNFPWDGMCIQMHGLIRSMARRIILDESEIPGMRSRLWIPSEVCKALSENKVTDAIEVLALSLERSYEKSVIDVSAFEKMTNLRVLKIFYSEAFSENSKVGYTGRLRFISDKLCLLCWHGFPFKFLPSNFYTENIAAIDLSYSHIKSLWTKAKCFTRLKVMKLRHCRNLTVTPDFTEIPNLEELYLDDCVNLVKVHPSIGMLNKLVVLSMRNCSRVESLQFIFEIKSLQVMDLSGCSTVDNSLGLLRTIKTLVEVGVDKLPSFVSSVSNLQVWSPSCRSWFLSKLQRPQSLVIPSLAGLCSLRTLKLSHCNLTQVPDSIGGLSRLELLMLDGNDFTCLPGSLSQLTRLNTLVVDGCKKLQVLPEGPPLLSVSAFNCTSMQEVQTPLLWTRDDSIVNYYLRGCPKLIKNMNPTGSNMTSDGSRNGASSFVSHFIKRGISNILRPNDLGRYNEVNMVFCGCRGIPRWFRSQSIGNSDVKVQLPHRLCYGFVTCVILSSKRHSGGVMPYSYEKYLHCVVRDANGAILERELMRAVVHRTGHDTVTCLNILTGRRGLMRYSKRGLMPWFLYARRGLRDLLEASLYVTFSFEVASSHLKGVGVRLISEEDEDHEDMDIEYIRMMEELQLLEVSSSLVGEHTNMTFE